MARPTHGIDEKLYEYCTPSQLEKLKAVNAHGSLRAAAKALGVNYNAVYLAAQQVRRKAAIYGYSPEHDLTRPVAPGQLLRGASTLYRRGEVEPVIQWVKTSADDDARAEFLEEFARTLAQDVKPIPPTPAPRGYLDDDLLCVVPLGDPHYGLYSWWQESGEDFDLNIAERLTRGAIDRLLASAPRAAHGLLLGLGDMFHADNQSNESKSGHKLDVDGRWAKVLQVGLQSMLYCVRRMLQSHKTVTVRFNKGNHDGHTSFALALMVSCFFKDEPRVRVDLSPSVTWYHQFGNVLIGSTHGDTIKGPDMIPVMAADNPVAWGQTQHRYMYVGHVHHQDVKEYRGGVVEYFRTLAARDAWHAGQGYRSGRDMCLIVLHRQHGEVERHRCDIGRLKNS